MVALPILIPWNSRELAEAYPDVERVKQLVSRLPWGHVPRLLQREGDFQGCLQSNQVESSGGLYWCWRFFPCCSMKRWRF